MPADHPFIVIMASPDSIGARRMQYHAAAFARSGYKVCLIDVPPHERIGPVEEDDTIDTGEAPHFSTTRLSSARVSTARLSQTGALLQSLFAMGTDLARTARTIVHSGRPKAILVEAPSPVARLAAADMLRRSCGARIVLDWQDIGENTKLKSTADWQAKSLATLLQRVDEHICGSENIRYALQRRWGIRPTVLATCPLAAFAPASAAEQAFVVEQIAASDRIDAPDRRLQHSADRSHLVVIPVGGGVRYDRAMVDEAIERLVGRIHAHNRTHPLDRFPNLRIAFVGLGARSSVPTARPETTTAATPLGLACTERPSPVRVASYAVDWAGYRAFLGSAELGIALHRSMSGMQLAPQIGEMLGAGLPVAAFESGPSIDEAIRPGENGLLFRSSGELTNQLFNLFVEPGLDSLQGMRRQALRGRERSWEREWEAVLPPLLHR